jgi:DNA-binding LacI/PurR family transcriptional regulator
VTPRRRTANGAGTGRPGSAATLGEVASAAGVSVATAARALGDYGSVSASTKDRVRAAAERLGYRPNHLARSMVTGTTRTLGVVVSDIENPFFSNALRGIADVAGGAGYEAVIVNTDEDPGIERDAVRTLLERRVDGLLVSPAVGAEPGHLQRALASGTPVVLLDRLVLGVPGDSVGIDNRDAARSATRRLVREGHTRIGLVTGDSAESHPGLARVVDEGVETAFGGTTGLRVAGYRDALLEAGLPLDPALLAAEGLRPEDASRATRRLFDLPSPPTAIVALDSMLALGVLQALDELGLRWPDDVSVIGFDDADWAEAVFPPLTVLAQPVQDIGRTACELLLRRVDGYDGPPEHRWLPTSLVERASVGRPPGR